MTDRTPSRRELLGELDALRRRVAELEKSPRPDRGRSPGPDGEVDLGRDLIQSLPVPLVAISPQGRVLMMNAVALEALGYQSEEVEGLDFLTAFVPEADREKFAEVLRRMIDGQQPTVIESRVLDKGGRRRLWEIHGRLVLPGNGRPPYSCCVGIDVTERRRTEAALRESEARYRALGEDMPALICRFLPEGTLTFVNGEYAAYLAKEPEELLGENFFQFVPESDRQRIGDHWSSLDAGRPARTYEHEVVGGDGSMRWRQWTDRALFDEQGRIVEYQSIGLDVTERRRTEEALRQSERQYRGLFKNAPIGLFQTALDGRPLRANPFLVRMLGFRSPDEALEWTSDLAKDFYANPEDRARLVKMLSQDERVLDFEVDLRRRDGTVFAATISAQAIRRDDGAVSSLEGFVQNVSMRKRAESDRVLLATAIEQTSEVVIVTDREGLIRYVNPAFERVTGHNREEAWGRIPWDIMRPDQADDTSYRDLVQAVLRGEVWCGRIVGTHKSGRQHELEMTASPVRDSQGAVAGFVAVGRDVTYELTMERQLRQAQKMEAIGTLAGGIAHDFNNLLFAISGYTKMALRELGDQTGPRGPLEQVLKAAERAADLVKQILTFSRSGRPQKRPVRVDPIFKEALKLLRASLPSTIEIRTDVNCKSSVIMADPTEMYQVLMNLCTNAAHAMRDTGGGLEVRVTEVAPDRAGRRLDSSNGPGKCLQLTVSDTGHGMDRKTLERIFDPFFTTKASGEGTGLGLSVVHGIVENHGGRIRVESRPGKGSTFEVRLPCINAEASDHGRAAAAVPRGTERILVVDDEEILADLVSQTLSGYGYEVVICTSGVEALETIRDQPDRFDLLIADQTMPLLTGTDLAKAISKLRPDLPVILCSGIIQAVDAEQIEESGVRETLMKPIDIDYLARLMRRILDDVQPGPDSPRTP